MSFDRPSRRSPLLSWVLVLLCVPLAFIVIGGAAYTLATSGIDISRHRWLLLPVAAIVVAIVSGVVLWIETGRPRPQPTLTPDAAKAKRAREVAQRRQEIAGDPVRGRYAAFLDLGIIIPDAEIIRREKRLAEIAGDPVKSQYAQRIFHGENISDTMIAYWQDPAMLVSCDHLRPIEADLRRGDPHMAPRQLSDGAWRAVRTTQRLDGPALIARYGLAAAVGFEPGWFDDRSGPQPAALRCRTHISAIFGA